MSKNIAIIGGGPMGLTCAYDLLKKGYNVDIYEKDNVIGGMSAHFDFSGLDVEKYYHFVCGPDYPLFDILKELGIYDQLKWTDTKMGYYYQGELYKWGGPLELLAFPKANIVEKVRYGLHVFCASKFKNWEKLDNITAIEWIKKWEGEKGYNKFWDSLFNLKFFEAKYTIAAPWLWSRLARVAKSRRSIFQERMGFLEGGSTVLLKKLEEEILKKGGRIFVETPIEEVRFENNKIIGIVKSGEFIEYDKVISTIPVQYINSIAPFLPAEDREKLERLDNVGVVCVIVKMNKELTENFWVNISDENIATPGMIEISNLNTSIKDHVIYIPFYLHKDNPMYSESDDNFTKKVKQYMKTINKNFDESNILDIRVFRYEYAQPITTTKFLSKLPSIESINRIGFYIADTAYCYPEDRSINESVKLAHVIANMVEESDEK